MKLKCQACVYIYIIYFTDEMIVHVSDANLGNYSESYIHIGKYLEPHEYHTIITFIKLNLTYYSQLISVGICILYRSETEKKNYFNWYNSSSTSTFVLFPYSTDLFRIYFVIGILEIPVFCILFIFISINSSKVKFKASSDFIYVIIA